MLTIRELVRPYIKTLNGQTETTFEIEKMTGDASNREYFRIQFSDATFASSMILMKFNPETIFRSEEGADKADSSLSTLPFLGVRNDFHSAGILVPRIYFEDVKNGLVFLEDLGAVQFFDKVAGQSRDTQHEWYSHAIELLVDFQVRTKKHRTEIWVASDRKFDLELLSWECDHYLEWGVEALHQCSVSSGDRDFFNQSFKTLCSELVSMPETLVHRDFQSRNIMVRDESLVLIDFQDALMGPLPYDLVALLRDSYVVLDNELVSELVKEYVVCWKDRTKNDMELKAFERMFHVQTVQRKLKDAGRFVFIDRVKKNPSFLSYIPDSLNYVRHALSQLEGVQELTDRLASYETRLAP